MFSSRQSELPEGIDPLRDAGQRLIVTVAMGSPGELAGGILRRRVVALPRHDHRPVCAADSQRLVIAGVTGRRHDVGLGEHLHVACHCLNAAALNEFQARVILGVAGGAEFCSLHEDRELARRRVGAAVVEAPAAVMRKPDVGDLRPDGRQLLAQPRFCGSAPGALFQIQGCGAVNCWPRVTSGSGMLPAMCQDVQRQCRGEAGAG